MWHCWELRQTNKTNLTNSLRLSSMAFAFGDWGSVLTESAFSRAFICLQSDSRVSRSDTRWGFFPILFNLRINTFSNFFNGNFKPKDPPCLFTHGLFLVWLLVYNLDFATKGGWINTHIFSSTCAEFLYLCLLWFTQGLKFFKLLLLCGDYRGYGCIGQSTENGIPGLRSRLPFAIYSQSKFHWSSLAKNHLKIQHIIIKLTQDYSHVALTKSCNTFWLISFIWKCHRLNYKKIIYSFQIFLTGALYDINWTHYRSGVLTWDHTGSFVVPNRLFSIEYFGTLWVVLGKVFERHLTDKSTNTHRHTNVPLASGGGQPKETQRVILAASSGLYLKVSERGKHLSELCFLSWNYCSEFQCIEINFSALRPATFANFRGAGQSLLFAGRGAHPWYSTWEADKVSDKIVKKDNGEVGGRN